MDSQVSFSKELEFYTPEEICEALVSTNNVPKEVCKHETMECNTPKEVQICHVGDHIGHRVVLSGNISSIQRPKHSPMLVIITDGWIFLQCAASESLNLTKEAASFRIGDEIVVSGLVRVWDEKNPGPENFEVIVEYWQLKKSPALMEVDQHLTGSTRNLLSMKTESLTCILNKCYHIKNKCQKEISRLEETLLACRAKKDWVLDCIQETFHSYLEALDRVKDQVTRQVLDRTFTQMLGVNKLQDQLHSYSQQLEQATNPLLDLATQAVCDGTPDVDVQAELLAQYNQLVTRAIPALHVPSSLEFNTGAGDVEPTVRSFFGSLSEEFVSKDEFDASTCQDEVVMDEDHLADLSLMSPGVGGQPTSSDEPWPTHGTKEDDSNLDDWYMMMLMEDFENEKTSFDQLEQCKDEKGAEPVQNKHSREEGAKCNTSRSQDVVPNRQVAPVTPNESKKLTEKQHAKENQTILPRKEVSKTSWPNLAKTNPGVVCCQKSKTNNKGMSEQTSEEEKLADFIRRHPKNKEPLTKCLGYVPLPRKSQRKN